MRTLARVLSALLVGAALLGPAAGFASATTIDDLIKLKNAKVSDDVLVALIESDGSVFYLNADDILGLKQKGLSEKVILAMIATATKAKNDDALLLKPAQPAYQPAEPQSPVMLTVSQSQTVEQPSFPSYANYATPYYAYPTYAYPAYAYPTAYRPVATQPVYWGFNGQRNPNAWSPSAQERAQSLKPVNIPHGGVPVTQYPTRNGGR